MHYSFWTSHSFILPYNLVLLSAFATSWEPSKKYNPSNWWGCSQQCSYQEDLTLGLLDNPRRRGMWGAVFSCCCLEQGVCVDQNEFICIFALHVHIPWCLNSWRILESGILTWNVSKVEYPHIKKVEHLHKLGHEHVFITRFVDVFEGVFINILGLHFFKTNMMLWVILRVFMSYKVLNNTTIQTVVQIN